jgi:uncharacterized membrane protein YbaN (DUF454 family)
MRYLYIVIGSISLGIGVVGIVIPLLPTTPFLLITAYCYARGSKRFSNWFVNTKLYEIYLSDFVRNRSMTLKRKWTLMIFVDLMLLIPFIITDSWWVRGLIISLVVWKYYYFFVKVKTTPSKLSE